MQILDGQDTSGRGSMSEGLDLNKGNSVDDGIQKQLLLICSEKAVYIYSLVHVVQGVKKVYYKKKLQSSSCCWASTIYTPDAGLILLFTNGKIQIRHLDSISQVYIKDLVASGLNSEPEIHIEKKKGIFSFVLKDMKGSKTKQEPEADAEDSRKRVEALSTIFTVANFPLDAERKETHITDDDDDEVEVLDIDDIDIEDPGDKPKGNSMKAALNKQKLTSKFQVLKGNFAGKLKQMKGKNERVPAEEEPHDEKADTVDQIKKKYGYTLTGEPSAAKLAQNKLSENIRKLQGIHMKTTEMQDTAISFSSMAKELLRSAEHDRRSS